MTMRSAITGALTALALAGTSQASAADGSAAARKHDTPTRASTEESRQPGHQANGAQGQSRPDGQPAGQRSGAGRDGMPPSADPPGAGQGAGTGAATETGTGSGTGSDNGATGPGHPSSPASRVPESGAGKHPKTR
ncbi:hypothetical protein V8Z80_19690 [Orrella sp. JC864]|uniref:hypothetical protein n=1 Tax=Orrella sp. JC864 TaxID=3120298 RepID=UPI0012BB7638